MTMNRLAAMAAIAVLAGGLAACSGSGPVVGSVPPLPQQPAAPDGPSVVIAAPGQNVREILVARSRARGANPQLTADAVVIERQLPDTNETLAAACGPHQPGRLVRVVLGTQPVPQGTRVVEQRFIVDGTVVCRIPLNEADWKQAEASLNEVKTQAEKKVATR